MSSEKEKPSWVKVLALTSLHYDLTVIDRYMMMFDNEHINIALDEQRCVK